MPSKKACNQASRGVEDIIFEIDISCKQHIDCGFAVVQNCCCLELVPFAKKALTEAKQAVLNKHSHKLETCECATFCDCAAPGQIVECVKGQCVLVDEFDQTTGEANKNFKRYKSELRDALHPGESKFVLDTISKAREHLDKHRYAEANRLLQDLDSHSEEDTAQIPFFRGLASKRLGNYKEAIALNEKAWGIAVEAGNLKLRRMALYNKACTLAVSGDAKKANEELERIINYLSVAVELGEPPQQELCILKKRMISDPDFVSIRLRKDFKSARTNLEKVIKEANVKCNL